MYILQNIATLIRNWGCGVPRGWAYIEVAGGAGLARARSTGAALASHGGRRLGCCEILGLGQVGRRRPTVSR
ncbi:hypothetical protein M758_UG007000 [Ceratodon purpureus]|nr:hypothetical protein M758_UG007000 [Ceratodon purpureus]